MTIQDFLGAIQFGNGTITASHPTIPGLSITAPTTLSTENEIMGGMAALSLILSMFHHAAAHPVVVAHAANQASAATKMTITAAHPLVITGAPSASSAAPVSFDNPLDMQQDV